MVRVFRKFGSCGVLFVPLLALGFEYKYSSPQGYYLRFIAISFRHFFYVVYVCVVGGVVVLLRGCIT